MLKERTAAGGVVFRQRSKAEVEVLLIKRNGIWDIPKGHLEKGESIKECAQREVAEETGCELPDITEELGTTYHEYPLKNKMIGKTTHWFAMTIDDGQAFIPQEKEGIEQVMWCAWSEAYEKVGFENLKKLLRRFKDNWQGS
jgi:8-oxo-dGTP pyrophosphatase MutT (NUDIX family)